MHVPLLHHCLRCLGNFNWTPISGNWVFRGRFLLLLRPFLEAGLHQCLLLTSDLKATVGHIECGQLRITEKHEISCTSFHLKNNSWKICFEKAKKIWKISTLLLTGTTEDKHKLEISQNFVAFSEYMKIITWPSCTQQIWMYYIKSTNDKVL